MTENNLEKILESSAKKSVPPLSEPKEIFSSRKHSMDYVTVDGVILRTGYAIKSDWYLLLIKELLDNSIDFLWKNYPGADNAAVSVDITMNDYLFHLKVRNTNSKNIPVFPNLSAILDYDMRYGSKQNQHIISRGLLGDAMKQILAWPYVLIHTNDDGSAFTDRQWDQPLIIRSNGVERHVFVHVDKGNQTIQAQINQLSHELIQTQTDTEIEITWPIIDGFNLDIHRIEEFCKQYTIFTTDISFQFRLTDNSHDKESSNDDDDSDDDNDEDRVDYNIISKRKPNDITSELVDALTSPPRKATIKIDAPRLHPISPKWNNTSSIHSYKPGEFVAAFTSVHDKEATTVYDILQTFREGTQIGKTSDTQISVAELIPDPHKDKKIESLYRQLTQILKPSERLSLPYSNIKSDQRKQILIERIAKIYGIDNLDTKKAVYKIIHDTFNEEKGKGTLHFPFAIEIIAIPFSDDLILNSKDQGTRFIGAVNYTLSPRGNKFDGNYIWDNKTLYNVRAGNIIEILEKYNFEFYTYAEPKTKLPCIIIANLISPRIDYSGHDKSRIDTQPFTKAIIGATKKIADECQTFKAAGYTFSHKKQQRIFDPQYNQVSAKQALKDFLTERKQQVLGY